MVDDFDCFRVRDANRKPVSLGIRRIRRDRFTRREGERIGRRRVGDNADDTGCEPERFTRGDRSAYA